LFVATQPTTKKSLPLPNDGLANERFNPLLIYFVDHFFFFSFLKDSIAGVKIALSGLFDAERVLRGDGRFL
jgi:hypothetical protein